MSTKTLILFGLIFIFSYPIAFCQKPDLVFDAGVSAGYIFSGRMPFWFRANSFGNIPGDGASLNLTASFRKNYDTDDRRLFDWSFSFEGIANLSDDITTRLIEGNTGIKVGFLEVSLGRSKEMTGLCDSALSSGSWSVSGNSLGIPKIELSVPEFTKFPFLKNRISFRGNYAHGWMGPVAMMAGFEEDSVHLNAYLHQKSFYLQFDIPSWKSKLYAGFNHQVVWCRGKEYYNSDFRLSQASEYLYVITGKRYSNGSISLERLGNHLGSIDFGFEFELKNVGLFLYRQSFYEAGALAHLANIQDGLTGLSVTNRKDPQTGLRWNKLLFEILYTRNQAGRPWSPETSSPYEPYYNHGQYIDGWSYRGMGLGSPFITTRTYLRTELPSYPWEYFVNNRVYVLHFGFEGSLDKYDCKVMASWSRNYGTYRTTDEEQSTGIPSPGSTGIFGVRKQFSSLFAIHRKAGERFTIGVAGAIDIGELYYNSGGILLTTLYSFN